MPGKLIVLKPVAWSPSGYRFPAGIEKQGKDFVAKASAMRNGMAIQTRSGTDIGYPIPTSKVR
jgi:hypothetical protein